jgi:GT2 family glycosyltransferase
VSLLSLIVPTRARVPELRRFLGTVRDTAADPSALEVIAVIDEDDPESCEFSFADLAFTRVLAPPGQTMGNLNLAGYRAARGEFLMLLNDDVVIHTPGWDVRIRQVLTSHPDGIVLAHVNDLIFREALCTFPALTRVFCELAGGICPAQYRRYCIDNHIQDVFELIRLLGHDRRVFLPDVIFEHKNAVTNSSGQVETVSNPSIHKLDIREFGALIRERRRLALACVERVEGPLSAEERVDRLQRLETPPDSLSSRRRDLARGWHPGAIEKAKPEAPRPALRARARYWIDNWLAELATRGPFFQGRANRLPEALFDPEWYRAKYPDAVAGASPLVHYLRYGGFAGLDPNPHFDSAWYLETNPDVAAAGLNPLVHFVRHGASEHRSPNLFFDVRYYESQNPEVVQTGVNPLEHFIVTGLPRGRSPLAGLTVAQYLERRRTGGRVEPIEVKTPVPLSIVIPTRNRRELLGRTIDACLRSAAGLEFELVIIDDGSTDGTAELLRERCGTTPKLRFESVTAGGPARARNLAAARARQDVILFLGDDIVPANNDFLRVHAVRHAEYPQTDFAVLGKVDWPDDADTPVTFAMSQAQNDGTQFAFSRLKPGLFASWQYFYASNLSVKKALVADWSKDGFDVGFPAAALEDVELAYRLWRSRGGLRLRYEPGSLGLHYHPHTLTTLLERQVMVGRSLRRMLELHPELVDEYGACRVDAALRTPPIRNDDPSVRGLTTEIDAIREWALQLEAEGALGSQQWHGALVSALFEFSSHEGYVSTWPVEEVNLAAAWTVMLDRLFSRIRDAGGPGRLSALRGRAEIWYPETAHHLREDGRSSGNSR